ncbi:low molecular weight phosphatase family protein [Halorhabdus sp. CBA1104]|uniref:arsenate-mycothiol transferase ArsC n=1 Tax=Halorhabdus sp. CBA1104 TaxID=1380432 RepID=UPI0012B206C1|nr:low molecular weight phosphatase family protein [Halorhabdus sp. CBA1104]QGN06168.1 low molecular weight phosphatase family protein [Halorhabdus sp. CBA1104]
MTEDVTKLAFVCVQNAGRSQMSTAFAERERERRGLEDEVEIVTGGTDPAEAVHDTVIETMADVGVDLSDRVPRAVSTAQLNECDVVATMGCSTLELDADVEVRDWALPDPDGEDPETVRDIRQQVANNVRELFEELFGPAE